MQKWDKQINQATLDNEKEVLEALKKNYEDSLEEINTKIAMLLGRQDADMQHVIYQVEYQKALKTQIEGILDMLQANEFETISEYLTKCYDEGFQGALYSMQSQGVPFMLPIDQEQVVRAIQHETKLSEDLYTSLGKDIKTLNKQIASEISRGISTGAMYSEIARNINGYARIGRNNAMRIARTEGHRIQSQANYDAQVKAKSKGADIVKIWSAALDAKTRDAHAKLDGQQKEIDEPFVCGSHKAMFPGEFGVAHLDINCRCRANTKARWLLDEKFTKMDNFTKSIREFNSPKDYDEFKEWYWSKENMAYMDYVSKLEKRYDTKDFGKLLKSMNDREYNHFKKLEDASPMWKGIDLGNARNGAKKIKDKGTFEEIYNNALKIEPLITNDMKEIAKELGVELYGLDKRIKSKESYLEKVGRYDDDYEIKDIVRYTFGTDNPDEYVTNIEKIIEKMNKKGYNTLEIKNSWLDNKNPYNGINSIMVDYDGFKFEVQYHTKESFEVKEQMHRLYEEYRLISDKTSKEAIELKRKMLEMSKGLTIPQGIERIKGYGQ